MKKNFVSLLTLSGLFLIPVGCSIVNNVNANSGSIKMAVKFPTGKNFSVKAIPTNTHVIIVQVSGTGINSTSPIFFNLTKDETSRTIHDVPQGDKTVKVIALSSNAELLAEGEGKVNIISQKLNRVEVELKETNKDIQPTTPPTVMPSSSASPVSSSECIITLKSEDVPLKPYIEQEIIMAGCKIVVETSPTPSPTVSPSIEASPSPTSTPVITSGGGAGVPSDNNTGSSNNVPVNVNVQDGQVNNNTLNAQ